VNEESQIMSASEKISCCDHKGKALKLSLRILLKAIKGATNVTYHTLRNRIPRWWTHVNIPMQFTIKKSILDIKMRDGSLPNRSHEKNSANSGHMSNRSKSLIIIMIMLLLKATSNTMSLIALKRTVRVSLNFIDLLTSDWTNTWGIGHKISSAIVCCHYG
jgi:hypothetical protein